MGNVDGVGGNMIEGIDIFLDCRISIIVGGGGECLGSGLIEVFRFEGTCTL